MNNNSNKMSSKDLDPFNYIDLKPHNYKSKQQLNNDLEEISKNLENITNDWKERELSLRKLGTISIGNQNQSDVFIKYFNTKLCNNLEIQLSDLRSSVMKEACRITSLCSRELGLLIEQGITQLLSANCLFKIAGSANKVISDSSSKCILNIVRYVNSLKIISNICEIKTMKANHVRILCAECLVNIISYYENNFIIKSKDIIEDTIKSLLVDANAEVRSTTRKAFILYKSRFEKEAENIFSELGKNVQKQINEDEKNFDNNFKINFLKHEKNEKYLKSISKEIDNSLNNNVDNLQNKPKTPEFNFIQIKGNNELNKENSNSNSNKINIIKKAKSNKKSVNKTQKNHKKEEKEETVKYINVDDDVADKGIGFIDLNENEDEKEKEKKEDSDIDINININNNNQEESKEINAVFNYSNKANKKSENKSNSKMGFIKKNQTQIKKNEATNNKLSEKNNTNSNPIQLQKENKEIIFRSQNVNNLIDLNKNTNSNLNNNNNINDIKDFNIDDLINNNKELNNSNNNKKHKKILINNSSKMTKIKSNLNSERAKNVDASPINNKNNIRLKTINNIMNNELNTNLETNINKKIIIKKSNTKFGQVDSGTTVLTSGNVVLKNNFIKNNQNREKSGEKVNLNEKNKIKIIKNNYIKKNSNNFTINKKEAKARKTLDPTIIKSSNININENDKIIARKILSQKQEKALEDNKKDTNEEEIEKEEELDTVDIDFDKNKVKAKDNNYKKSVNINNNVTHKENIIPKNNTFHFSKSSNRSNKNNLISSENFINNALNNNNNNNKINNHNSDYLNNNNLNNMNNKLSNNNNYFNNNNNSNNLNNNSNNLNNNKENNLLNNETIEEKINVIIDKVDNLINQNEKLILFQYLFNYFNSTLNNIKTFSKNTIKRYIDIHIENLKENDKNLVEQIIKNLMRMIFYMSQIFNTYEIESILKILLFSINDINDKTVIKLSNQLLEIIKKKCDNEELFKSVYSLLGEFNNNYDNCYEFMYLLIPECGNILNNSNYFKQLFRLICLTDKNSKKVGKIIDILYRKYSNNFNQAYEGETPENKQKLLMFMEKSNSLYFREFKSLHENDNTSSINPKLKIKNNEKNINISQMKKENNSNEIVSDNKEAINNNKNNNISNIKNGNLSNNISYKNNIIYNQNNKNINNINTINTNINGNNIISINNSNNNNIIITNKLPDESIPNEIKICIQNNNLEQYILYMEEHKSYIPEFILLLSNKKYNDDKSTITLLNFTKNLLNSNNFTIDLDACLNLMIKQLIYILTSHKNNEKIAELIKNILSDIPINLNSEKSLSSMAKYLNSENDSIILETVLLSFQNFIINMKNRKKSKNENNDKKSFETFLDCFITGIFNLLNHPDSEIRKRTVYCCVEIYFAIGKEFEPFLMKIPKNHQNLIKHYFIKKKNG